MPLAVQELLELKVQLVARALLDLLEQLDRKVQVEMLELRVQLVPEVLLVQ